MGYKNNTESSKSRANEFEVSKMKPILIYIWVSKLKSSNSPPFNAKDDCGNEAAEIPQTFALKKRPIARHYAAKISHFSHLKKEC